MYETSCQSKFNARYWMLGAGALGFCPLAFAPDTSNCPLPRTAARPRGALGFQNFPLFIVIHTVKGFGIVNKETGLPWSSPPA